MSLLYFILPVYVFINFVDYEPGPLNVVEEVVEEPWMDFTATAYVSDCKGCTGYTYYQEYDVRNTINTPEGYRVIAVDPEVIPLGSLVEIEADGKIFIAKAMDIGRAIKNRKIDLLVWTEAEAFKWGVKDIRLRVIE